MKNYRNSLSILSAAAILSVSNFAFADLPTDTDSLSKPSETTLRCFYENGTVDGILPGFAYEWGIDPKSLKGSKYHLSGKWSSGTGILANMFYTEVTREELRSVCNYTFQKKNIEGAFLMYAAADTGPSFNYTIWHLDPVRQSGNINKMVVFGDSLSDTQNFYNGTDGMLPSPKNYFAGRFSNGKIWVDYLSESLNLPVYNWAVGGAESGNQYEGLLKGIKSQVKSWVKYTRPALATNYLPENTLFTMEIGGNDLLDGSRPPEKIIYKMREALDILIANKAKHILLLNLPDISLTPFVQFKSEAKRKKIAAQVVDYNNRLATLVEDIRVKHREVNIQLFDLMHLMTYVSHNKELYGITDGEHSCLKINSDNKLNYLEHHKIRPECQNAKNGPDSYAFWDLVHPTTHTYKLLADGMYSFVQAKYGFFLN